MANDGRELTFTVSQSYPEAGTATESTGGNWPDGTYSIKVVAWYVAGEGVQDNAGFIRADVAAWHVTCGTGDNTVTVTWDAANRVPHHYSLYFIEAGTWVANGVIGGRKIAEVNGDVLTSTITTPYNVTGSVTGTVSTTVLIDAAATFQTDNVAAGDYVFLRVEGNYAKIVTVDSEIQVTTEALTGSGTYDAAEVYDIVDKVFVPTTAASYITMNPVRDNQPNLRPQTTRSFQGRVITKAYAQFSPLDTIQYDFYQTSVTEAYYNKLVMWIGFGTRVRVSESSGAEALISVIDGVLVNASHMPTRYKSVRQDYYIVMRAEAGTIT